MELRINGLEKAKRNAVLRETRAKEKCKDYLALLEEKNLLSAELADKLNAYRGKS